MGAAAGGEALRIIYHELNQVTWPSPISARVASTAKASEAASWRALVPVVLPVAGSCEVRSGVISINKE